MTTTCTTWHTVATGDICRTIAAAAAPPIALSTFFSLNPGVNRACTNLWPGQVVCVGPEITTVPVVGTTTEPSTIAPGTLTIAEGCKLYHNVKAGDICYTILEQYDDPFTLDAFLVANPSIDAACSNLRAGIALCVAGTVDKAPGAIEDCVTVEAKSGDTCHKVVERTDGLTLEAFFTLNPAIRNPNCENLVVGTKYCVSEKPPAPPTPPCLSFCPATMDGDAYDPARSTINAYGMTCGYKDPKKEPGAMQRSSQTPIKFGGWTVMTLTGACPQLLPLPETCSDGPPVLKPCFECPAEGHRADAQNNGLTMKYVAGDKLNCRYDNSYWCYYDSQTGIRSSGSYAIACDKVAKPLSVKPSTCPAFVAPTPDPPQCFECPDVAHFPGMTTPNMLQRGGGTRLADDMATWTCYYSVSFGSSSCRYNAQTGKMEYEGARGMCDKIGKPVAGRPSECSTGVTPLPPTVEPTYCFNCPATTISGYGLRETVLSGDIAKCSFFVASSAPMLDCSYERISGERVGDGNDCPAYGKSLTPFPAGCVAGPLDDPEPLTCYACPTRGRNGERLDDITLTDNYIACLYKDESDRSQGCTYNRQTGTVDDEDCLDAVPVSPRPAGCVTAERARHRQRARRGHRRL